MTIRWDPSGSARLAFFEEKKTAASVSQELIPDNLNASLLLIQQWVIMKIWAVACFSVPWN